MTTLEDLSLWEVHKVKSDPNHPDTSPIRFDETMSPEEVRAAMVARWIEFKVPPLMPSGEYPITWDDFVEYAGHATREEMGDMKEEMVLLQVGRVSLLNPNN